MGWYIYALVIPAIIIIGIFAASKNVWPALTTSLFLLVMMVMFGSLTVTADRDTLGFHFGIGIIRKKFRYDDIESVTQVRNHWLMGWGIRWFGRGWLYNVSGLDAIELRLKSGKVLRIGTDEPERLISYLRTTMGR